MSNVTPVTSINTSNTANTANAVSPVATAADLNKTINALITQRETWEDGTYKAANAELYAILAQCGALYEQLLADKKNINAFNAMIEERGVSFNKGTGLSVKIIRLVFGKQGNREFAYARVLKVWHDERTDKQTLSQFVIERGGIESVRRASSKPGVGKPTAEDYRLAASTSLANAPALTSFEIADYMTTDEENTTDYFIALVRNDSQGKGHVVFGSNQRSLVDLALAVIGKQIDDRQRHAASKADEKKVVEEVQNNIAKFLETMTDTKVAA